MHVVIILCVEDREQYKAGGADHGENGGKDAEDLLTGRVVVRQSTLMPQPPFANESEEKCHL